MTIVDLNLDEKKKGQVFEINSPRSLEAFKRVGIELEELEPVDREECKKYYVKRDMIANPPADMINLRYNNLD